MATPNPITVANVGDPLSNADWTFDGSNFLTGASGVGITIGSPTGGDIANSINVAGGYYINGVSLSATFAPAANPTFTGVATIPTATITTLNATTLNAGNTYLTAGGKNILTQRASTRVTGVGTSYANSTTSFLMNGWGLLGATITPTVSGTVLVMLESMFETSVSTVTGGVNIYWGSGTAPSQGAAATGTALLGSGLTFSYAGGVLATPINAPCVVTGLTIGTAYWFDFGTKVAAGTGSVTNMGGGVVFLAEI